MSVPGAPSTAAAALPDGPPWATPGSSTGSMAAPAVARQSGKSRARNPEQRQRLAPPQFPAFPPGDSVDAPGRPAAIPFAAPVPRDYYAPHARLQFQRERYFEHEQQPPPRRFAAMPPSASPLFDLEQGRPPGDAVPTVRYEVAVDVDLRDVWAAPPAGGQHWEQPVEYAASVGMGGEHRGANPFPSNGRDDDNGGGSSDRQRWPRRDRRASTGSLRTLARDTGQLTVFHLLNACLGFAACSVVTSGASLGLSTLPMCCLGVLVFRILFYVVYAFAQFDMMLGNYIAPPDQFMYAVVPPFDGQGSLTGYRLAPTLACFSPLSLMALLYFCSVKVGVAVLSLAATVLFLAPPVTFLASLATGYAVPIQDFGVDEISLQSNPAGFSLAAICLTLVGFALLHGAASLSLLATRFFVCEKFTVYRYPPSYMPGVIGYSGSPSPPPLAFEQGRDHHHHHHHHHHHPFRPGGRTRRERRSFYPVAVVSYGTA